MARTAPPGYDSNTSAYEDFFRFAPAIWTLQQVVALMFHIERSAVYGRESDRHSERQALDGIYSKREFRWIRGPSGLSRAAWYKANRELELDGVIRRNKHETGNQVTEYAVVWEVFKSKIALWKETHPCESETGKGNSNRLLMTDPSPIETGKSDPAPTDPSPIETARSNSRLPQIRVEAAPVSNRDGYPSPIETGSASTRTDSKGPTTTYPSPIETHSQTLTLKSYTVSQTEISRTAIADAIENATGDRPKTDRLIDQVIDVGLKFRLPQECVVRWIHDFCFNRRAAGYMVQAGLVGASIGKDIVPWMKKNEHFIAECQRRRELERQRQISLQMPAAAPAPADPAFAQELITDLKKRVGKVR